MPGWIQGVPLDYAQELCAYWQRGYDWRRCEAELNSWPQFRTGLDGGGDDTVEVHLIHARSPHPGALPLLLTHGWPGSVVEFLDVLDELTDPPDAADAFHVVAPSLPGYGFSAKPTLAGWGIERIAVAWAQLMDRLGYDRYGAQGGDWGSVITSALGTAAPENVVGIHLTMPLALRPDEPAPLTKAETKAIAQRKLFQRIGTGLLRAAVHPAADARLRARRLADGPVHLDRGEVLGLDRLRRPPGERDLAGPVAGQRDAVLAAQHRSVLGPAVLGELRQASDGPGGGAHRRDAVPAGAVAAAAGAGSSSATPTCGTGASRPPVATSPASNSPRSTSTRCAPSSGPCAERVSALNEYLR